MPAFKLNYIFGGPLTTGWVETFYLTAVDYTTALGKAKTVAEFRGRLCGTGVAIQDIRVSDDGIIGDSLTEGGVPVEPIDKTKASDVSWTAAQLRLAAGTLYRRTLMMRGIPDYVYGFENDELVLQPEWKKALDKYLAKLIEQQFAIKAKNRGLDNLGKRIKSITQPVAPATIYTIETFDPHTLGPGFEVFIYNIKEAPKLGGKHIVLSAPTNTTFTINVVDQPAFLFLQKAYIRPILYIYPTLTKCVFVRIAKRDTGRPLGLYRGRAR